MSTTRATNQQLFPSFERAWRKFPCEEKRANHKRCLREWMDLGYITYCRKIRICRWCHARYYRPRIHAVQLQAIQAAYVVIAVTWVFPGVRETSRRRAINGFFAWLRHQDGYRDKMSWAELQHNLFHVHIALFFTVLPLLDAMRGWLASCNARLHQATAGNPERLVQVKEANIGWCMYAIKTKCPPADYVPPKEVSRTVISFPRKTSVFWGCF